MKSSTAENVYEALLLTLFVDLDDLFIRHGAHPMRPLSAIGDPAWDPTTGRVCTQDDRCEQLNELILGAVAVAFPVDDQASFLSDNLADMPVAVNFRQEWQQPTSLRLVLRDLILQAITYDVHARRLFPDRAVRPVHPALTRSTVDP